MVAVICAVRQFKNAALYPPLFLVQIIPFLRPFSAHFNAKEAEVEYSFPLACSHTCYNQYAGRMVTGDTK